MSCKCNRVWPSCWWALAKGWGSPGLLVAASSQQGMAFGCRGAILVGGHEGTRAAKGACGLQSGPRSSPEGPVGGALESGPLHLPDGPALPSASVPLPARGLVSLIAWRPEFALGIWCLVRAVGECGDCWQDTMQREPCHCGPSPGTAQQQLSWSLSHCRPSESLPPGDGGNGVP